MQTVSFSQVLRAQAITAKYKALAKKRGAQYRAVKRYEYRNRLIFSGVVSFLILLDIFLYLF